MVGAEQIIVLEPYDYGSELIEGIRNLIISKYQQCFEAVLAHGSFADNSVIPYSDFDGLLIVRNEYVNSAELQSFKKESLALILKFDPLQHHGWFQLSQRDLRDYDEHFLPKVVLESSKLIYPYSKQIEINVSLSGKAEFCAALRNLLTGLLRKMEIGWKPKNLYQLKSFLSEIMLLPTLVYSCKNQKGIHKKHSFELARPLFSENEWSVIDKASELRVNWVYELNAFQRILMTRPERVFRKLTEKILAPSVPKKFYLDDSFYQNLNFLLLRISKELDNES